MTKTTNYQLNQWDATDRVLREDFNSDNRKIDAALGEMPHFVIGTYTGDGAETRTIPLDFTPKALYVVASDGMAFRYSGGTSQLCGGLVFPEVPAKDTYRQRTFLEICEGGFRVACNVDYSIYLYTNQENIVYHYIAWK